MPRDWKELSEAASREQDPQKLLDLVEELDKALEQREKALRDGCDSDEKGADTDVQAMVPGILPSVA